MPRASVSTATAVNPGVRISVRTANRRSALIKFSSGVQVVVVQDRVEDEEVASVRLAAPDRVVREEDDVALVDRNVDDHRPLRDLGAGVEQARDEQIAGVTITHDDPRTLAGRDDADAIPQLLLANR